MPELIILPLFQKIILSLIYPIQIRTIALTNDHLLKFRQEQLRR